MSGPFDDLIPQQGQPQQPQSSAGPFDDLIPKAQSVAARPSLRPMSPDEETNFLLAARKAGITNQASIPEAVSAVGNRLNSMVRGGADMLSMGTADRVAAGLGALTGVGGQQGDYAGNLVAQRQADQSDPNARLAGQAIGGLALPGTAATVPRAIGLGAAQGGAYMAGSSPDYTNVPQVAERTALGTVAGGAMGGLGQAVAGGAGKLLAGPKEAPAVTAENIASLKNAAYAKADQLGAAYTPEALQGLVDKIATDAKGSNLSADIHPAASAVINNLQLDAKARAVTGEPVTLTQLDQMRQMVNRDVTSSNVNGERYFGKQMTGNIDNFIANSGPEQMAAGSGPEAASAIQEARDLNTRFSKSAAVQAAVDKAERQTNQTGSGGNIDNALRQKINAVYASGKNWTPEEEAAFQTVNQGQPGQNLLRSAGKLSPTGSGLTTALELGGAAMAGPHALAVPAIGVVSKILADRATKTNIRKLSETILAGKGRTAVTKFGKFPRTQAGARALAAAMTARGVSGNQ